MYFYDLAYEEHILQICEAFAEMPAGRADMLRRALVKEKTAEVEKMRLEFWACAERHGRTQPEIEAHARQRIRLRVRLCHFARRGIAAHSVFCRGPLAVSSATTTVLMFTNSLMP